MTTYLPLMHCCVEDIQVAQTTATHFEHDIGASSVQKFGLLKR